MDTGGWTVDVLDPPYESVGARTAVKVTVRVVRRVVRGKDPPVSLWHWCLALSRLLGF